MAKKEKNSVKKGNSNPNAMYVAAGIIFAAVMIISMVQFVIVNAMQGKNSGMAQASSVAVYTIKEELLTVNRNILQVISEVGDSESLLGEIETSFSIIDQNMSTYEHIDYHSEQELKRYEQAKKYIIALRNKLNEFSEQYDDLSTEERKSTYLEEISTYQSSAQSMFDAAMENSIKYSQEQQAIGQRVARTVVIIMGALLVVGEIAIVVAARIAKKAREEAERQERQAEAADRRFKSSQEKINDIAFTNILTDMKNRYALENDIGDKLDSEDFNIAVFDMDNFRSINDIYGYDFGDEYLVQISDRLKNEFSEFAEFYNITGNEFCAVFKRDVSDVQAARLAENILQAMTSVYNVANIGIQLTASGSTYHCLRGECMNLSALLVKMDNVLRNAKRNGGNTIMTVVGI